MPKPYDITIYLQEIQEKLKTGHAREHAYRPPLEKFCAKFTGIKVVNDPKRSEHGAPDFIFLENQNQHIIKGYGETKDITVSLDKIEKDAQMRRYAGYANLVLTNYLEFRFYRNGEKYKTIILGKLTEDKLEITHELHDESATLVQEFQNFFQLPPEIITKGSRLAEIMGAKARRIKENVSIFFTQQKNSPQELFKIKELMQKTLIPELDVEQFANMYAQTLVYGLFIARCSCINPDEITSFSRENARELIPVSHPFLRTFFDHIAGIKFERRLAIIVDELCTIFRISDLVKILDQHHTGFSDQIEEIYKHDPIIHFYEDFLKEYDPKLRQDMGAYYTPVPIVRYIIRSIDRVLIDEFNIVDGLASDEKTTYSIDVGQNLEKDKRKTKNTSLKVTAPKVQILDPATGTGTFLNEVINFIYTKFVTQKGMWPGYVKENLLPRLNGFELMMAPYTVAHLKLGMTLRGTGYADNNERINIFLTNSLEETIPVVPDLFTIGLIEAMGEEAKLAAEVKNEKPVMVILGNPPWKGESSNKTYYAKSLIERYKKEPESAKKLSEQNPKWINDDYVKFIALAEKMIVKNRSGIMGMITNNGYLDNPTFRGMRWHLRKTFDSIYIVNLHGSVKIQEKNIDGSIDQNVFNIQQGNAIIIAVKNPEKPHDLANVYYADLYGKRKHKFSILEKDNIEYQKVPVDYIFHSFVPVKNIQLQKKYFDAISVVDLFNKNVLGFQTHRDDFAIAFTPEDMLARMQDFSNPDLTDATVKEKYDLHDSATWKLNKSRKEAVAIDFSLANITPIAYRPFDTRYTFYSKIISDRPRPLLTDHVVDKNNLVLGVGRQGKAVDGTWSLATIANNPIDANLFRRGGVQCFPIYIYTPDGLKVSNLDLSNVKKLCKNLPNTPSDQHLVDYIYGLLHHPTYRIRYAEFLSLDYPRITPPETQEQFSTIQRLGEKLVDLHLFRKKIPVTAEFPIAGTNIIETIIRTKDIVYINNEQYFATISDAVWNFSLGGYLPAQRWLQERKSRTLTYQDLGNYLQLLVVIQKTIDIQLELTNTRI